MKGCLKKLNRIRGKTKKKLASGNSGINKRKKLAGLCIYRKMRMEFENRKVTSGVIKPNADRCEKLKKASLNDNA